MLGAAAAAAAAPLLLGLTARAATYPRIESWHGDGFIDGFRYPYETYDNTTNGDVFWATADNTSLIYVNDADRVIMKVDNTSFVPYNEKRYSSKLYSKNMYDVGTVWVMDAVHTPYGCSVWPALFTHGENWPEGGEIDIFEGINQRTRNQYALHVESQTCTAEATNQLGNTTRDTCGTTEGDRGGCTVMSATDASYGAGFAQAGGGVYIAEFATEAIRIWFFQRSDIPSAVSQDASEIDTSSLGTPDAEFLSSGCNVDTSFTPQMLVLGTTLCGDWAAVPDILAETCPPLEGDNTCYTTYVIDDAEATYAQAYFELNYINVFSTSTTASGGGNSSSSGGGGGGSSGSPSATTTVSSGPGSSSSAAGAENSPNAGNKRFKGVAGLTTGGVVGTLAVGLMGLLGVGLVL